jgi:mRNA-degrading endonuclease RelE of RelBE toxin-antitoxin system
MDSISPDIRKRVFSSIETKLAQFPDRFGHRLRRSLAGLWKLRVGDIRVVFELNRKEVVIWAVINRKDVYEEVGKRYS